jgi:hypothetical protein
MGVKFTRQRVKPQRGAISKGRMTAIYRHLAMARLRCCIQRDVHSHVQVTKNRVYMYEERGNEYARACSEETGMLVHVTRKRAFLDEERRDEYIRTSDLLDSGEFRDTLVSVTRS